MVERDRERERGNIRKAVGAGRIRQQRILLRPPVWGLLPCCAAVAVVLALDNLREEKKKGDDTNREHNVDAETAKCRYTGEGRNGCSSAQGGEKILILSMAPMH